MLIKILITIFASLIFIFGAIVEVEFRGVNISRFVICLSVFGTVLTLIWF